VISIIISFTLTLIFIILKDEDETESELSPLVLSCIFFVIATITYGYLERNMINTNGNEMIVVGTFTKNATKNMKTGKVPF